MSIFKKTPIWLAVLGIVVLLGFVWMVDRANGDWRVLSAFVQDLTTEAQLFEAYRSSGLDATPSVTASNLQYIAEFQMPAWSAGSVGQPGSVGSKYFASAPQRTQYCVKQLQSLVERERNAAIRDLIGSLRRKTGQDLGDDPQRWVEEYASKK